MKAAVISDYNHIEIKDVEKPELKDNQVLVKVNYAAINPFDIKLYEGKTGINLKLPITPGGDLSGTVAFNPNNPANLKVGQAVFGEANAVSGHGAFAEYAPVDITQLAIKDNKVDFKLSAAVPLIGCSAYQAIKEHINLQPSQTILIHGGAGGIGSIAVQLSSQIGAKVIATASSDDLDYVKQLGACEVIDYKKQDFSKLVKSADAVFDTVGGDTNSRSYAVLKNGGTLVSMTTKPDDELVKQYTINYVYQQTKITKDKLDNLMSLLKQNKLTIRIGREVNLNDISLAYAPGDNTKGKTVIQIAD